MGNMRILTFQLGVTMDFARFVSNFLKKTWIQFVYPVVFINWMCFFYLNQLGLGTSCQTHVPALVCGGLTGKKVIEVACGSHHSLALTNDGEVYAFGQNNSGQVGCGSTANQPTPRRVSAVIGSTKIVSIACGQTSSFASTDLRDVFLDWSYIFEK